MQKSSLAGLFFLKANPQNGSLVLNTRCVLLPCVTPLSFFLSAFVTGSSCSAGRRLGCVPPREGLLQSFRFLFSELPGLWLHSLPRRSIHLFLLTSALLCGFRGNTYFFFPFLPVLAMSASHLNKSPLLGNNLIDGECIAKETMYSIECGILKHSLGLS